MEKAKTVGDIFKLSYDLSNENPAIYSPIKKLMIFGVVDIFALFYFILGVSEILPLPFYGLGLVVYLFLTLIYKYFFNAKMEMRLSWILKESLLGEDANREKAKEYTKKNKYKRIKIAFIDIFFNKIKPRGSKKPSGVLGTISSLILNAGASLWRLVNHFLISAMVVEDVGLKEGVVELKTIKENLSETLGGFFAIDITLLAFKRIVKLIDFFIIVAGIALTILTNSVVFLLLSIGIALTTDAILVSLDKIAKVSYYTVLYTVIKKSEEIPEEKTIEVNNFLKLEK